MNPIPLTDLGNAERFFDEHQEYVRFCPELKLWLVWNGRYWQIDEQGDLVFALAIDTVRNIAIEASKISDPDLREKYLKHAQQSESIPRIRAMLEFARRMQKLQVRIAQLDADPMLLQCKNVTIDLRTGTPLPPNQNHFITKLSPVIFDPAATCPTWDSSIEYILPDKQVREYLQRAIGYGLTGRTDEQCFFILYGLGGDGKSEGVLNPLRKLLGTYARHTPIESLLAHRQSNIRNDIARLQGSRFVTACEADMAKKVNEASIKSLTGGDPFTTRFLYREFFEFTPTFKLFIASNYKFEIRGVDRGIWRRIHLIPFKVSIPEDKIDKCLPEKLELELSGILNWALKGCLEWQRTGLNVPDIIKHENAKYRKEMDTVGNFIADVCILENSADCRVKNLYDTFLSWADENCEDRMGKKEFGAIMRRKGFSQRKSGSFRMWEGIGLKKINP